MSRCYIFLLDMNIFKLALYVLLASQCIIQSSHQTTIEELFRVYQTYMVECAWLDKAIGKGNLSQKI